MKALLPPSSTILMTKYLEQQGSIVSVTNDFYRLKRHFEKIEAEKIDFQPNIPPDLELSVTASTAGPG